MVSKSTLYAAISVATALIYGLEVGPYWVTDAIFFAMLALAVAYFSFKRKVEWPMNNEAQSFEKREYRPRSRIAHYVSISRAKFGSYAPHESLTGFERSLLSEPGWQKVSGERLEEISIQSPTKPKRSQQELAQ